MPDARWKICSWETPDEEFPFSVMASNRGGTNGEHTNINALMKIRFESGRVAIPPIKSLLFQPFQPLIHRVGEWENKKHRVGVGM